VIQAGYPKKYAPEGGLLSSAESALSIFYYASLGLYMILPLAILYGIYCNKGGSEGKDRVNPSFPATASKPPAHFEVIACKETWGSPLVKTRTGHQ